MSYEIEFQNVSKVFPNMKEEAVKNVSLGIKKGDLVVILGTSGSGKSTFLKMINGIFDKTKGKIYIKGNSIDELDMTNVRRSIGYVIQQIGLFPHMTIYENIATVPKILKWNKEDINSRVKELLNLVHLSSDEYKDRYPMELSGGQKQRVGLARALAANPSILLMDEPFASLDAITRSKLQDELLKIHGKYKNTIVFVSHDIGEAIKIADKIIVMNEGEVLQYDTPYNIINNPENNFVKKLVNAFDSFTKPYRNIKKEYGD